MPSSRPSYFVPQGDELLCPKELADQLKRHRAYVSAMRRDGFIMPGGRATLNHALRWLYQNPLFKQSRGV